jgi:uncharacterized protein (TIGR00369 family)
MKSKRVPFLADVPFVEHLGFELHEVEGGDFELRIDLAPQHLNHWKVGHGGVVMTMLDVAMATAARWAHRASGDAPPGVATIEMKTSFTRPAQGRLRARGKLLHASASMAFCEAFAYDDDNRLCAHATGTFKYVRALPLRSSSAERSAPKSKETK